MQTVKMPPVDLVAPIVHQVWLQTLKKDGITSRLAPWRLENGEYEELAVEWPQLSARAKAWNCDMVRTVYYCADVMSDQISL